MDVVGDKAGAVARPRCKPMRGYMLVPAQRAGSGRHTLWFDDGEKRAAAYVRPKRVYFSVELLCLHFDAAHLCVCCGGL